MDRSAQLELESIKREIQSIITELESIASAINRNFEGIGNEKCASRVYKIADRYKYVKKQLNAIDTSKVSEDFAKSQSGVTCS